MNPRTIEFKAASPEQWEVFQDDLLPESLPTQKEVEERVPMSKFLEIFRQEGALDFPFRLVYAIDTAIRPDFQLWLPTQRIAIELTRIETSQQRRARKFHPKVRNGVLDVSSFLANPPSVKLPDIYNCAFATPSLSNAASVSEQIEAWLKLFAETVKKKAEKRTDAQFDRGDEDWLLLWDQNSIGVWDIDQRVARIEETLHLLGQGAGFHQVYVLDQRFQWLIGSRQNGVVWESALFNT